MTCMEESSEENSLTDADLYRHTFFKSFEYLIIVHFKAIPHFQYNFSADRCLWIRIPPDSWALQPPPYWVWTHCISYWSCQILPPEHSGKGGGEIFNWKGFNNSSVICTMTFSAQAHHQSFHCTVQNCPFKNTQLKVLDEPGVVISFCRM